MLGDLVYDGGEVLEVVWCGEADRAGVVPPLCPRHTGMESPLAGLAREQYGLEQRYRNRVRQSGYQMTPTAIRKAKRELRGFGIVRGGKRLR